MSVRKLLAACLICAAYCIPAHAQYYSGNLNLVPASSNIALDGWFAAPSNPFVTQGTGSLTTSYTGTVNVVVDLGASTIQFVNVLTPNIAGNISGTWNPQVGGGSLGVPGSAPAVYGIDVPTAAAKFAYRNLSYVLTSPVFALVGAGPNYTFNPTGQVFTVGAGSLIDAYAPIIPFFGTLGVSGNAPNASTTGNLSFLGGTSFNLSFGVDTTFGPSGNPQSLNHLSGSLLATGNLTLAVPEPTTYALIGLSLGAAGLIYYRRKQQSKNLLNAVVA